MIKPLTSLRFFFALAVFLSHYLWNDAVIFAEGYIGVSFFFMLSGFILAYSYKDRLDSKIVSSKEFYIARLARIYPLHILTFIVALGLLIFGRNIPDLKTATLNLTLLQSWVPIKDVYFSVNSPSWSISDEAFFYLLFPLIILSLKNIKRPIIMGVFIGFIFLYGASTFVIKNPEQVHALLYVNPLFRLLDFILGIALFLFWQRKRSAFENIKPLPAALLEIGSIFLLLVMIAFSHHIPQTYTFASYYWVPMLLIILFFASLKNGIVSKLLSTKYLVIAGEISFGFYMWHVPIMNVSRILIGKISAITNIAIPKIVEFSLVFFAIFVVSLLSFYYFETPMNKWVKKLLTKKCIEN